MFVCHFWQSAIFGNSCHEANSCHFWQLWGQKYLPYLVTSAMKEIVAFFDNFEFNKNCHFWQFLDSIITDEGAKYCQ